MKPSENVSSFIQMVVLQYLLIKNVNFLNFIISTDKKFPIEFSKKTNKRTNKLGLQFTPSTFLLDFPYIALLSPVRLQQLIFLGSWDISDADGEDGGGGGQCLNLTDPQRL